MYNIRFSTLIYFKKHVLCVAVTLVGGYFKPVFCLLDILFATLALKNTLTQIVCSLDMPQLGGDGVVVDGLCVVLLNALADGVEDPPNGSAQFCSYLLRLTGRVQ